jgi:hypothetical protein
MNYELSLTLSDGALASPAYNFKLKMINTAPKFSYKIEDQKVQLKKITTIKLPEVLDLENNPISFSNIKMPNFASFDQQKSAFIAHPKDPSSDLGSYIIKG